MEETSKSIQTFEDYVSYHYTGDDVEHITAYLEDEKNKKIFDLSLHLIIWSLVGVVIDIGLFLFGSYLFSQTSALYLTVTPLLIFFVINLMAKFIYAAIYLGKDFEYVIGMKAAVPYLGSAILIYDYVSANDTTKQAIREYLGYFKDNYSFPKMAKLLYTQYGMKFLVFIALVHLVIVLNVMRCIYMM